MKRLVVYYLLIFIPLLSIVLLAKSAVLHRNLFVELLFFYVFIYRTWIDYIRLKNKNRINKKEVWKLLLPGARIKYFRDLYFV